MKNIETHNASRMRQWEEKIERMEQCQAAYESLVSDISPFYVVSLIGERACPIGNSSSSQLQPQSLSMAINATQRVNDDSFICVQALAALIFDRVREIRILNSVYLWRKCKLSGLTVILYWTVEGWWITHVAIYFILIWFSISSVKYFWRWAIVKITITMCEMREIDSFCFFLINRYGQTFLF